MYIYIYIYIYISIHFFAFSVCSKTCYKPTNGIKTFARKRKDNKARNDSYKTSKYPRLRLINLKCMFFFSQIRYRLNSNGYTNVFGVRLSIGTHGTIRWCMIVGCITVRACRKRYLHVSCVVLFPALFYTTISLKFPCTFMQTINLIDQSINA